MYSTNPNKFDYKDFDLFLRELDRKMDENNIIGLFELVDNNLKLFQLIQVNPEHSDFIEAFKEKVEEAFQEDIIEDWLYKSLMGKMEELVIYSEPDSVKKAMNLIKRLGEYKKNVKN